MQTYLKFIRRHLMKFILLLAAILVLDIVIFGVVFQKSIWITDDNQSPVVLLRETENALTVNTDTATLPDNAAEALRNDNVWAMFLTSNGKVIWSQDLPAEISATFTVQDVAMFTRGYLEDYPVFVQVNEQGLLVLGYPKDSYTKIMANYYPLDMMEIFPLFTLGILAVNFALMFLVYFLSKRSIIKSITPAVEAMDNLSQGKPADLQLKGDLAEIGVSINRTSDIIQRQNTARANWISGVSHDIRTPLSMIMGYADRICEQVGAADVRAEAEIIRHQSQKINALVQDLNLVSQLEYEMQPLKKASENPAKLLREIAAEYINNGLPDKHSLELSIDEAAQATLLECDRRLLKRAILNLVNNCIVHNPDGCVIQITGALQNNRYFISVSDNGVGASEAQLNTLKNKPHYLSSTDNRLDLRHGLGLLLVGQIIRAHDGGMRIDSQPLQGFQVELSFPL